ncbi:MAG TPA: zinc dependent phospholipase C family protein [Myxococcaceae bacterium]|nr:zinc dependent phospholipase C family protein [Myxococcaceae bacterium]
MPSLLLHAAAVERLAEPGRGLPPEMERALQEDLEYARLGAFLPDLPWFDGLHAGLSLILPRKEPRFARVFHDRAPVAMGLKMAELVSLGALVGTEAGLAFVCGYFTHLCLDRVLHPVVEELALRHRLPREEPWQSHRRIEWAQALFYLQDMHGRDIVGTPLLRGHLRVQKQRHPTRGVGRGLYELLRLSAQESLGEAPAKVDLDGWVRGLYLYGWLLSSRLGKTQGIPGFSSLTRQELYRGDTLSYPDEVERALGMARQVLGELWRYMARGLFTARSRTRFLASFPEGGVGARAA